MSNILTHDMNNIMTRVLTVIMLMMFSMGAQADVKVLFGEDGKELEPGKDGSITLPQKEVTGGTVVISQEDLKDGTTKVILSVAPDKGYSMAKAGPEVWAAVPTNINSGSTRTVTASTKLDLKSDDYKDIYQKRTYYVTIDSKLALWVKNAMFGKKSDGAKGSGANEGSPLGNDYSGTYYIANYNNNSYSPTNRSGNYYLCPSSVFYDYNTNQKPYLTTHKPDENQLGTENPSGSPKPFSEQIAKWNIEYVKTEDNVDYYYIKYVDPNGFDKYLVHNGIVISGKEGRIRYHLQTDLDAVDNNNLFFFTKGYDKTNKRYDSFIHICSKAEKNRTNGASLNPAKANTDSYIGVNVGGAEAYSQGNTTHCGGLIGHYDLEDKTGLWFLEDIIKNPIVTINGEGKAEISSSNTGTVTYYYAINGAIPSTTTGNLYNAENPIDITSVKTIKAIAIVDGESSNVATYTVGTGMPFIIQNQECTAYYLISGDETANNVPANTSSIAGPKMEWLLKYAGNTNGIQYYHIVNNATKKYLYRTEDYIYVKEFSENDDGYKFNFFQNTDGSYNLFAKDVTDKSLYKKSGNVAFDNVVLSGSMAHAHAHWKFITTLNVTDKRSLFDASPVTVSNYYKMASLGTPGSYIISPVESGGIEYAGVSTTEANDNMVWMFEEAGHDEWQTYYNIVSATTGKYLYFVGPAATSTSTQANAIEMKDNRTDNERYQYVLARATTEDYYYIIPKTHKDVFKSNQYYSIWLDTDILKTTLSRKSGAENVKWKFEDMPPTYVAPPFITFDPDNMKVYMESSTQNITKIQYGFTKGTEAAPTTATIDYSSGGVDVKYGPIYHFVGKAIKGENESILSPVKDLDLSYIETPTVEVNASSRMVTFSTSQKGITFYYTTAYENTPSYTDKDTHTGEAIEAVETDGTYKATIDLSAGQYTIKVIAVSIMDDANKTGYSSLSARKTVDFREVTTITSLNQINNKYGIYKLMTPLASDLGTPSVGTSEDNAFEGILDGDFVELSLSAPLFKYVKDATIKNVILDNVNISEGTTFKVSGVDKVATGSIACVATGTTRIYNCGVLASNSTVTTDEDGYTQISSCSSSVSGSDYVGGLVGYLDEEARVINCFSYANITGGDYVGGIVGYNNVATTSSNLKTMVMNCMFYGDIDTDYTTNRAPIYNGEIITNRSDASGVSNFNYFWAGASYVQSHKVNTYNCALAAETRFLQRFEFFRHLLNSNRALAAWWATDDASNKDEMMKWVLEPSQIGTSIPYPTLKAPIDVDGKYIQYSSVVNYSPDETAYDGNKENRNKGQKLTSIGNQGILSVTIQNGTGGPTGAGITNSSLSLTITDKAPGHFNFNYGKVQLPYYNDVGSKNYTGNKVVTGWKIVSISGGTHDYSTGLEASASVNDDDVITLTTPYNFADRKCTDKDKFSVSGRVFNQGAYFDVPEGVTSITIEPYWAECVYVSDSYPNVVYNQDMSSSANVTTVGTVNGEALYTNGTAYTINGSSQIVYTSMSNAVTALNPSSNSKVYDNAIVLVGNVHSNSLSSETNQPYTIMSIDLDEDNEPDYSYILRFNDRKRVHPVRIDFLNVIGLGMAQKSSGGEGTYNLGIMQPLDWFEVTNTGLFRVTQFEYDRMGRTGGPMILHGGVIEQWVTVAETSGSVTEANAVDYYHVGSNVWFKEFHIGAHQDRQEVVSPHPPISVTGGDFDEFYLTGLYNTPSDNYPDNAECYINGGRFNKVAGTGMQGIGNTGGTGGTDGTGNIIWQIDNADIDEFYAGGINAAHIAEGNIFTVITNSRVDQFCGGPKFGDMNHDKKVVTNAADCTFRTFFGAGFGGNSYNRRYPTNKYDNYNYAWDTWLGQQYNNNYDATYGGVETRIDYQFIPKSDNTLNVARLFVDYVSFSLATTHNVTSKLTDCTITKSPLGRLKLFEGCIGNFYGGGSLGKVAGPLKSTLIDCTVEGNVFGAGYSATLPSVEVMNNSFQTQPKYDTNSGSYLEAQLPSKVTYTWEHANTVNSKETAIDVGNKKLFTTVDLSTSNLGSVEGEVTLTITGTDEKGSEIGTSGVANTGNVFGGGESSYVTGAGNKVTVNLQGKTTVHGNVFGGGNEGVVSGSTTVNIEQ